MQQSQQVTKTRGDKSYAQKPANDARMKPGFVRRNCMTCGKPFNAKGAFIRRCELHTGGLEWP